ncbi:hypothetical protein D3C87_1591600 [compost metagenome]
MEKPEARRWTPWFAIFAIDSELDEIHRSLVGERLGHDADNTVHTRSHYAWVSGDHDDDNTVFGQDLGDLRPRLAIGKPHVDESDIRVTRVVERHLHIRRDANHIMSTTLNCLLYVHGD